MSHLTGQAVRLYTGKSKFVVDDLAPVGTIVGRATGISNKEEVIVEWDDATTERLCTSDLIFI
jgi:hypothetical protein